MFKKSLFALLAATALSTNAQNIGFETGDISGWNSSTLTATGAQTVQAGQYSWSINPYGNYMGTLQIQSGTFSNMTSALGLTSSSVTSITSLLQSQSSVSGGNPNPTTAGWVTKSVTLTAGTQFNLAWQYVSVDYVPYNDGSIATLTKVNSTGTTVVNNYNSQYALLGFTNPGTGDYSTGSYGATGWQVSTFNVTESGTYLLGFGVFNLGDTALSPILYIDEVQGTTTKNGEVFGAVAPNNDTAPSTVTPTAPTVTGTSTVNQVQIIEFVNPNATPTTTVSTNYDKSKVSGVQAIVVTTAAATTTSWVRNIAITPITTTTYSDSSKTTTTGTTTTSSELFSVVDTSVSNNTFSGRADQAEQFDVISTGLYRNLNRQNARNGVADEYGRLAINVTGSKFAGQNGYSGNTYVTGLSYETDVDKNLIVGAQINKISGKLNGVDTTGAGLDGYHVGVYADYNADNGVTLQNDIGYANIKNRYSRTIGPFSNSYANNSNATWWSARLLSPEVAGFRPFIGSTVLVNRTPTALETGSVQTAQTINGNNNTQTFGEAGLQYSAEVLGGKVTTEAARTSNGITDVNLSVSKADGNTTYAVYAGRLWLNSTTTDTVGASIKIRF